MSLDAVFVFLRKFLRRNSAENHNIFLWCVDSSLLDAELFMLSQGYKRHARFVWDKMNGVAPAFSVRYTHEYLVWFYKGKFTGVASNTRGKYTTILREKAREHSRKPECVYDMLNNMFPSAKKYDVFSRQLRDSWQQYGDQKTFFGVHNGPRTKASKHSGPRVCEANRVLGV